MDTRTSPASRGRRPTLLATLRVLAVFALVAGVTGSLLLARAWGDLIDRQRDERLERMAVSRTASVRAALDHTTRTSCSPSGRCSWPRRP